ncbi:MAG: hypothetical protein ACLP5H_09825 [Desulfomonilaceae bacterium]
MGSLRDLKRESKTSEAPSDTMKLYFRLQELAIEHDKSWETIAEVMAAEGFKERGEPLTANALRKRYMRWKESERTAPLPVSTTRPGSTEPVPLQSPIPGIEELISLNNQLLEQVRESNKMMQGLGRRLEEQQQTSHTGVEAEEQPVTSRDLLELIKEMGAGRQQMRIIEEGRRDSPSREKVEQLIEDRVQETVEVELRAMLAEDGSFSRDLNHLIDRRLSILFSGGDQPVKTTQAGPGRGRKGKTHKKFSASLEESLFDRVKSLPGQFSGHLSNALEAYLAVMEEKKED